MPLLGLGDVEAIDITFDGADAVDPNLELIKGLGGALLREKIVATSSRRLVILVGEEKLTDRLGRAIARSFPSRWSRSACRSSAGGSPRWGSAATSGLREGQPVPTDNGNYTLDLDIASSSVDAATLNEQLRDIPGVVETGFFLGMAGTVLIQHADGAVEVRQRPAGG